MRVVECRELGPVDTLEVVEWAYQGGPARSR